MFVERPIKFYDSQTAFAPYTRGLRGFGIFERFARSGTRFSEPEPEAVVPPPAVPVVPPPRPIVHIGPPRIGPGDEVDADRLMTVRGRKIIPRPVPAVMANGKGPSATERQTAHRIYVQHQKLKALSKARAVSGDMAQRSKEFAKFLTAYIERYKTILPAAEVRNFELVVAETPGVVGGLSFIPLVIFGLSLVSGAFITHEITSTVNKNLDLQNKEVDARLAVYQQGGADATGKVFGKPTEAGFFGGLGDFAKYALLGGLVYVGWKFFAPKRRGARA